MLLNLLQVGKYKYAMKKSLYFNIMKFDVADNMNAYSPDLFNKPLKKKVVSKIFIHSN